MPRGGPRANQGRPRGAKTIMTELAQAEAKLNGVLPHEFLLMIVRGDPIQQTYTRDVIDEDGNVIGQEIEERTVYPDLAMRHDAAKAAAPYYAPRLATQVITLRGREDVLNKLTDEQLDDAIRQLEGTKGKKGASSGDDQS